MTRFSVRALTEDDQPMWREMRLDALRTCPKAFLTTAAEQEASSAENDRIKLSYGAWRGVFSGGALVGIAALIPMPRAAAQHRMEVGAVYVTGSLRGTGAACVLMEHIEAEAVERGALQLELEVASDNARAIAFYERRGFERVGLRPRAMWTDDGPQDDYCYVKFLDRNTQD